MFEHLYQQLGYKTMGGYRPTASGNNRKMTRGRVSAGKNTFKGTESEHYIVKVEKRIKELSRMVLALDIKMQDPVDSVIRKSMKQERDRLKEEMSETIDYLEQISSGFRFKRFMNNLHESNKHVRSRRGLKAA